MKKILIIANYKGPIGGISGQVEQLQNCLTKEGYVADVFSTQGNIVRRVLKFIQLIGIAHRYDVLHIHGCSFRGMLPIIYGVIAGKIWHKRIIVTYHGGDADEYFAKSEAFAKRWLKRVDQIIVLNGYLEMVFKKYNISCIVIPNCITLSNAQEHSAFQWDAPRFLSVRHLSELYNIPCILCAYTRVREQLPNATLTLLGDGPMRTELEEFVESRVKSGELKEGSVRFVGQVKNNEVAHYMAQADILLSAPHIDNMPVSVLEAMNARTLVISSRVGGVPYIIDEGRTGLLFESGNTDDLASQMLWAVKHRQESLSMIEAAHEDVKKYSWENIRRQLLPLYE